jgi:hypothetical protein
MSEIIRSRRRRLSQAVGVAAAGGTLVLGLVGASPAWATGPVASTLAVAPGTLTAGSTGNTLTFTYGSGNNVASGTLTITFPKGFSAPSGVTSSALTNCTKATTSTLSMQIIVHFACAAGGTFQLTAPGETAPKTAGPHAFSVDTTGSPVTAPPSINVVAGPTAKFTIKGLAASTDSEVPASFTVAARDTFGNVTPNYLGTVKFASTDERATMPAPYPFVPGDAGRHTFTGVLFFTPGAQTVNVADLTLGATGSETTTVQAPTSVTVTPATPSIARNGTQQFSATATYADGTTVPNDTHVIWSSVNRDHATIGKTGLAAGGVSVGTTTIAATLSGIVGKTTLTVIPGATSTQVASSSNPSVWSQPINVMATVSTNGAPGPATGTVSFTDNGTPLGTESLVKGVATLPVSNLSVATHPIVATYNGDANNLSSPSPEFDQTVNAEGTTTTLNSSLPSGSSYGQDVTFTATVSANSPGVAPPSGFVSFSDSQGHILAAVPVSNGTASFDMASAADGNTVLPVGNDTITATFTGTSDSTQAGSSGQFIQSVSPVATTLGATSNGDTTFGTSATLSVTISPDPAATAAAGATGTITVTDASNNVVGTATVTGATTQVTLSSTLPAGSNSLTVSYNGDGNYQGSTTGVTQNVNQFTPTVSDVVNTPGPYTAGESIQVTVTVTGVGGVTPTGSITWDDGVGDTFGPLPLSGGSVTTTVSFPNPGTTYNLVATYAPDSSSPSYTGANDSPGVSISTS